MRKTITGATLSAMLLAAMTAQAGPAPADKCEASKNKTAGAYYSCRQKAESTAISKATSPDYSKCSAKFDANWDKAEADGTGMCPDTVLTAPMNAYLAAQAAEAALVISGAIPSIPDCAGDLATCNADLAACEAAPAAPTLKTGQTSCYDSAGTPIACAGTGQDGDLQKGVARSFTDNLDGTITDNVTGLMWEKLSDDDSIHDWNTQYVWSDAVTAKIVALNSAVFAGHGDWRLPNRNELLTLANIGTVNPATFAMFHDVCAPGCTVETCSCTQSFFYWSSSAYHSSPSMAWFVNFDDGTAYVLSKTMGFHVRAVRSGS